MNAKPPISSDFFDETIAFYESQLKVMAVHSRRLIIAACLIMWLSAFIGFISGIYVGTKKAISPASHATFRDGNVSPLAIPAAQGR